MEPAKNSGSGSGNSGGYTSEAAETIRFQEEIQSLMRENLLDSAPENGSYFTALLGLPATQAMELLHEAEPGDSSAISSSAAAEIFELRRTDHKTLAIPLVCSPTFPSNAALVERAARFSVFASEESPASSSAPSNSGDNSPKVKNEPADSESIPILSFLSQKQRSAKRKEPEKNKARCTAKKGKSSGEKGISRPVDEKMDGNKLPYVHVRARRGQATDSHSLAERARREKINARMKLLQELVPGCNKISGTALVLDEIINHVQSLQRQVELLSMRLAAVNPRIDFSGLDILLAAENERLMLVNGGSGMGLEPSSWWPEGQVNGGRRRQQQILHVDLLPTQQASSAMWGRDDDNHGLIDAGTSLFDYHSADSVALQSSRLKTEM